MSRPRPGDIVSRRKGFVMHRGIALGDGRVLHNTPFRGEHISSETEFRAGKRLYTESSVGAPHRRAARLAEAGEARSYNLFTNNCEHTVSRVTEGRARSPQLRGWVVGAGLAAAAFVVTRHPVVSAAAYALGHKWGSRKDSGR